MGRIAFVSINVSVSMFSALLLVHFFLAKWNGNLTELRCLRYIKRNDNEYATDVYSIFVYFQSEYRYGLS